MRRERETGGLLTLEEISLLRMVLAKAASVLLARNLKSFKVSEEEYLDQQMVVKVLTLRVFLVFLLDSTSLVQIDTLME